MRQCCMDFIFLIGIVAEFLKVYGVVQPFVDLHVEKIRNRSQDFRMVFLKDARPA